MIANVKFHVTRCHAVTPYKSVTLPEKLPEGQLILLWLICGAIATAAMAILLGKDTQF